jgi:hypothetical protein
LAHRIFRKQQMAEIAEDRTKWREKKTTEKKGFQEYWTRVDMNEHQNYLPSVNSD